MDNPTAPNTAPVNVALSIEVQEATEWRDRLAAVGMVIAWGHRSFGIDDIDGLDGLRICPALAWNSQC